ncbi:MAG: 1,4-dihydroxy-6-naphthoate synthase [Bacteroidota bacterium]
MHLTLGFSPCPNDTFIFYGLLHNAIDTEGLQFDAILEDVEALNQRAFSNDLNITKLSYHAYAYAWDDYVLLDAGSALGNNVGPLLIAKKQLKDEEVTSGTIAIPGKYTTAHFLFNLAYPNAQDKQEKLFSEIENAVLTDEVDAGVIIHENRFTYQEKGLFKIQDLGEYWESNYHLPIPLGGIVVRRDLPDDIKAKVNRVLARSVAFAFDHPEKTMPYVRQYAQEMEDKVMQQHIDLYVNEYTRDLGEKGKMAIEKMYVVAREKGILKGLPEDGIFLN